MGFGILTVGYYLTYLLGMIWKDEIWGILMIVLGCITLLLALLRLSEYESSFRLVIPFDALMLLPTAYRLLSWLSGAFLWDLPFLNPTMDAVSRYAEFGLFLTFGVTLLYAVREIATDVEDTRIVTASVRNLVFLGIYAICQALTLLPFEFAGLFALGAMLVQLVFHVLMGVMLVSCYMRICDESDRDMPLKKSRFAWVNRMREARAEREQRAADSVTEYAENRLRKKREERERILREQEERRKKQRKGKR